MEPSAKRREKNIRAKEKIKQLCSKKEKGEFRKDSRGGEKKTTSHLTWGQEDHHSRMFFQSTGG